MTDDLETGKVLRRLRRSIGARAPMLDVQPLQITDDRTLDPPDAYRARASGGACGRRGTRIDAADVDPADERDASVDDQSFRWSRR
jgi:hypothetical protein